MGVAIAQGGVGHDALSGQGPAACQDKSWRTVHALFRFLLALSTSFAACGQPRHAITKRTVEEALHQPDFTSTAPSCRSRAHEMETARASLGSSITSSSSAESCSFWVGSLALHASSLSSSTRPAAPTSPISIAMVAAHHLFEDRQLKERVKAEEWPQQIVIEGVCNLRPSHASILRTAVPVLLRVITATPIPAQPYSSEGERCLTYMHAFVGQLRTNMQAAVVRVRERTLLIVPTRRTLVGFMVPESAAISLSERRSLTASGLRSVHYQGRSAAILDPMNEESREGLREIGNTCADDGDEGDDACIITEVRVASRKRPREDNQEKEARRTGDAKRRELDSSETDRDKSSMPGV